MAMHSSQNGPDVPVAYIPEEPVSIPLSPEVLRAIEQQHPSLPKQSSMSRIGQQCVQQVKWLMLWVLSAEDVSVEEDDNESTEGISIPFPFIAQKKTLVTRIQSLFGITPRNQRPRPKADPYYVSPYNEIIELRR